MRLVEIFGISRKSKVEGRKSNCFDGRKSSGYFPGTKFRRNVPEFSKIDSLGRKSWYNCWIFDNCQKFGYNFRHFWLIFDVFGHFKYRQLTKMVKNPKNYTGNFDCRLSTVDCQLSTVNFWLLTGCRKCTKIFVFRLSAFPVHFPEKTWNSLKALPIGMTLVKSLRGKI